MSFWRTLSARSLRKCKLDLNGEVIANATLFPFFDGRGLTERILVVRPDTSRMEWFEWGAGCCRGPYWEEEVRVEGVHRHELNQEDLPGFGRLWHYDPWWVLKEERFVDHWAPPELKQTNCVNHFKRRVHAVRVSRDLARMHGGWVWNKCGVTYTPWRRLGLTGAPEIRGGVRKESFGRERRLDWVLSPVWER